MGFLGILTGGLARVLWSCPVSISPELLNSLVQMNFANAPVPILFLDAPPAGLPTVERADAAGSGIGSLPLGASFYTSPEDHGNCAVGADTPGVTPSATQSQELRGLAGTMIEAQVP